MRKAETTWLVIADGIGARILAAEPMLRGYRRVAAYRRNSLEAVETADQTKPASPSSEQQILNANSTASAAAPALNGGFARRIGASLNRAAARRQFKSLVLIAPSRTLSELVGALDSRTLMLVKAELVQDLTRVPDHDLPGYLKAVSGS